MVSYGLATDIIVYLVKNPSDSSVSVRAKRQDGSGDAEIVRLSPAGTVHRSGNLATPLGFTAGADGFILVDNPE